MKVIERDRPVSKRDWVGLLLSTKLDTDKEVYRDLDEYIDTEALHLIGINVEEQTFGYEYGSESGVQDLGPSVEIFWEGEGEGIEINGLIAILDETVIDQEKYEFETTCGDRDDRIGVTIIADLSEVDIERVKIQSEPYDFVTKRHKFNNKVETKKYIIQNDDPELTMYHLKGVIQFY